MKRLLIATFIITVLSGASLALAQRTDPETMLARQQTLDQGLFMALAKGDLASMVTLRDQGADPNVTLSRLGLKAPKVFGSQTPQKSVNTAGWPILTWAVYMNDIDAIKLLLKSGARVNTPDVYGATALHWAAWGGYHEIAKLLLNNGASCKAADIKGRTPKDWAVMMGQNDLVRLLDSRTCRPAPFLDSDRDGVPDDRDMCPDTPFGAPVDERGCWVVAYSSFFDFDKSVVKSQYIPHIVEAATVLKNYPDLKIEIQGHTDSVGTEAYNHNLGLRRAEAVKKIMINNGISASRFSITSKGESQPIADNKSSSGRSRNRRVEIHVAEPGVLTTQAPIPPAPVK